MHTLRYKTYINLQVNTDCFSSYLNMLKIMQVFSRKYRRWINICTSKMIAKNFVSANIIR